MFSEVVTSTNSYLKSSPIKISIIKPIPCVSEHSSQISGDPLTNWQYWALIGQLMITWLNTLLWLVGCQEQLWWWDVSSPGNHRLLLSDLWLVSVSCLLGTTGLTHDLTHWCWGHSLRCYISCLISSLITFYQLSETFNTILDKFNVQISPETTVCVFETL